MENAIKSIYKQLFSYYGPQNWWPGDTPFEIMMGAILTQNTSWTNVERAIINLKPYMDPRIIYGMDMQMLSNLIKPSGFYNIKAKRIKSFLEWFAKKDFSMNNLKDMETISLRCELLLVNGIGKETADSIILYAVEKPIFVIDAYTRRLFARLGFSIPDDYDDVQSLFENNLKKDLYLYNEYHALIVTHSKEHCKAKPSCTGCPLNNSCSFYISSYIT